jgi:hypothetical protein
MKKRQFVLPCGRVVFQRIHTAKDIGLAPLVSRTLLAHKQELSKLSNPDNVGRKNKEWCESVFSKFANILLKKTVDNLMNSNRIQTAPHRFWVIGNVGDRGHVNWETDGNTYAVTVHGMKTGHRIMLSGKRRRELRKRILEGQSFH